ncbi:transcription factor [Orobanche hederae]
MKEQGVREDKLHLLSEVTSAFRPGILTALMGVSGAGKTTLMDVLVERKIEGYVQGDIRISGFPKNQSTFARILGYYEQIDTHSPQAFVDQVMDLVELDNLKDAIVGIPGVSGLSTEQRKRLTIAVELIANPSIIFMDEPTSGLDARAAAIVLRTVRNTVDTWRTVVCTIHQPSIDIFEAVDEAIPGVPSIKDKYNSVMWMLEVSSVATEARLAVDLAEYYKSTHVKQSIDKELSKPAQGTQDLFFDTQYSESTWASLNPAFGSNGGPTGEVPTILLSGAISYGHGPFTD